MSSEFKRFNFPKPKEAGCPYHPPTPATHYPSLIAESEKVVRTEVPFLFEAAQEEILKQDISSINITSEWQKSISPMIIKTASLRPEKKGNIETPLETLTRWRGILSTATAIGGIQTIELTKLNEVLRSDWKPIVAEGGIFINLPAMMEALLDKLDAYNYITAPNVIKSFFSDPHDLTQRDFESRSMSINDELMKVRCIGAGVPRGILTSLGLNYALKGIGSKHHISFVTENNEQKSRQVLHREFSEALSSL